MDSAEIEFNLRTELRFAGIRWQKCYRIMGDYERLSLIGKMRERRGAQQLAAVEFHSKQLQPEPEDDLGIPNAQLAEAAKTLNHGVGGGHRVIRSTRHLGG